jgi:deoxyribodipyrimidine photo-lyase
VNAHLDSYTSRMPKRFEHPELVHPTTKRAKQVDAHTPYEQLQELLAEQKSGNEAKKILHWFRSKDLRIQDNKGLHAASELAKKEGKPLLCAYVNCPAEFEWHGTSPARTDFNCENLAIMQKELKGLNIPLVFLEATERNQIVPSIVKFIEQNDITHVFANYEYEVDELRRDVKVLRKMQEKPVEFSIHHDQTVVEPGTMLTGSGTPMKIFTPYHAVWLQRVRSDPSLFDTVPEPSKQSSSTSKELKTHFGSKPPTPPLTKKFANEEDKARIRGLWPAGHAAGMKRWKSFVQDKIDDYAATRSNPGKDSTSRMSAYLSAGVVSVRELMTELKKHNKNSADFTQNKASTGVYGWVREIVFRELYRQTTMTTPHLVMNLPQNLKFNFVQWEDDKEGWEKWKNGTTGVPLVDAGMRQLNTEAYMHNRARMNVSSYLYCNLLLDYRRGERYFAETLIDWDFSNNTQGWEPSYTVFNPTSQAEKNDPDGEYIRQWVPELKDVKGKAVFAPDKRLSKEEFEKLNYPRPHVDWHETKQRCLERFKRDMKDAQP